MENFVTRGQNRTNLVVTHPVTHSVTVRHQLKHFRNMVTHKRPCVTPVRHLCGAYLSGGDACDGDTSLILSKFVKRLLILIIPERAKDREIIGAWCVTASPSMEFILQERRTF